MDEKNNTPSTPCISLIYALDCQLGRIFAEGLEARWQRHLDLAEYVRGWVRERGFDFLAAEPYRSITLTCAVNSRNVDLAELKKKLGERGYAFDNGYGKLKGKTFRIAHMGDMQLADLQDFTAQIDDILS